MKGGNVSGSLETPKLFSQILVFSSSFSSMTVSLFFLLEQAFVSPFTE